MTWLLILIACAVAVLLPVMIRDSNRFVPVEYRIPCRGLKKEYRFVLLSDLHCRQFGEHNGKLLAAIDGMKPESVLIAGDMLTSAKNDGYLLAGELVGRLAERYPVYYVNGNHECRMKTHPEHYGERYRNYHRYLTERGVTFLENASVCLPEQRIRIHGVEIDESYYGKLHRRKMTAAYLSSLLGQVSEGEYHILIAHNPEYFPAYAQWGADLVLSGHVHGGIMRLPWLGGVLSPSLRLFPKYDGGLYQEGKSRMVLGRGLGSHTIPIRIFNPGELIMVRLMPET